MSTAVQLKLLTLLNVSAVKRPFDLDQPGGHKRSSLTPDTQDSRSLQSEEQEPKKKKQKRRIVLGGEIGPSGSEAKLIGEQKAKKDKKGKAKAGKVEEARAVSEPLEDEEETSGGLDLQAEDDSEDEDEATGRTTPVTDSDPFLTHFSVEPLPLTPSNQESAESSKWKSKRRFVPGFERVCEMVPEGSEIADKLEKKDVRITPSILATFQESHPSPSTILNTTLDLASSYKDLFLHGMDGEADGSSSKKGNALYGNEAEDVRSAIMMHAVNHVMKSRRKIIRNNEKLAHSQANNTTLPDSFEQRDQSFTRPKVLLLLPFRSLALHWLQTHLFPLAPEGTQIENLKPFTSSFSLPEDIADPLADPEKAANYPRDHISTFSGNSDDNFRFGIKFTRKAWRVILPPANEEKLIGCDIIIASPLGIRMGSDKEGGTDSLSSIEICVADGLDVMAMQNWEHVQFTFQNMNKVPNNPHGCDFSRVKPWYLDNQSKYLRQSILLSRYETPEFRSLFNRSLYNVEGKIRVERTDFEGVLGGVRKGVKQVFTRLKGEDALEELEARFKFFTQTTLPALMKSAVASSNTMIVVPSYFDFVRVTNHMRKMEKVSFAAISEYSSNQEISAARTSFFKGKKSFLVITERFHFYRRYRLRGAKTIVFYALPEHAQYYSELMASPFLLSATGKQTIDIDEAEVTSRVAFSKFDYLKLERVVGTESARKMIVDDESKFTFV